MSRPIYVVDTSYLAEFYKVGKHCKPENHKEVQKRFNEAIKNKYRLYLPVPVIFEVANHIAHVNDGKLRRQLAQRFNQDIQKSFKTDSPFILVPCEDFKSIECLAKNLIEFAENYASEKIGLTDTSIYLQAKQLYQDYKKFKNYRIHIWTLDTALKAKEPDSEPNQFVVQDYKKKWLPT